MSDLRIDHQEPPRSVPGWLQPGLIVLTGLLAYAWVIPWLGFYWDDWAFLFIRTQLGADGLTRYFSTNRPFIAWIPQITIPLFGTEAWKWQIFHLVIRILAALAVWRVFQLTWKKSGWLGMWVAILFLVYPGFDQQPIAINYSDFGILFNFLMLSFILSLRVAVDLRYAWLLFPAVILAGINHIGLDYFLMLEFLRPVLIWFCLTDEAFPCRLRFKRTLLIWLPFLLVWLGIFIWRFWFFPYQTQNYELGLIQGMKESPWATLGTLALVIVKDVFKVWLEAWVQAFRFPSLQTFGLRSTLMYVVAGIVAGLSLWFSVTWFQRKNGKRSIRDSFIWIGTGIFGMLIAGWPFWVTRIPVGLIFPNSRFTLPFVLGVCLAVVGLVSLLPGKPWLRNLVLAILVAGAVGYQIRVANEYRRDWNIQKNLFWQLAWRAPAIEKGTVVVSNDTPIRFASDNSLVSPLNWMYSPDNHSDRLDYMFFYPSIRLKHGLKNLTPDMTIENDYLAARFVGTTNQLLAVSYQPPGCLRILDPELDKLNPMQPILLRQAVSLSRVDLISGEQDLAQTNRLLEIFGDEPEHGWCYYFEKADLARQQGDWEQVVALGEAAAKSGDYPNDPVERLVFVEGNAFLGNWQRAFALTEETAQITPVIHPVLCKLWERIEQEAPSSPPEAELMRLRVDLQCHP